MELRTIATYARTIRPVLPKQAFAPATSRVLWLPFHAIVIGTIAWALAAGHVPALLWPVASIIIGCSLAGITFLGHEALHGAVVRGKLAIKIVGFFGFLPFTVSPTLWTNWHNRVHHNHCGQPGIDPDMYPTLLEYETQRSARIMADHFGLGRRRLMSLASLFVGFTGQSQQMLWNARKLNILSPGLHRRAFLEFFLGVAFWATVAVLVGFVPFIFVYLIPLVIANAIVMAFILSNHNLSPLTPVNDPLVNSLSVRLPRVLEFATLDFGFHTEHHLFPAMSTRHGRVVRDALRAHFGAFYQSLPLWEALRRLYNSARVYKDDTTLIDPPSGETFATLMPREAASDPRAT
ncbi:MAG: fatty acid desaturase [Kofleriaceae bacterium]|nr:fatty acid desaturase [Kofleriaceae bacterium]